MDRDDKCYYCNKLAIAERREVVDVDADCDIDPDTGETVWFSVPLYKTIGVCADHLQDDDEPI
jgi:hypothetical protein